MSNLRDKVLDEAFGLEYISTDDDGLKQINRIGDRIIALVQADLMGGKVLLGGAEESAIRNKTLDEAEREVIAWLENKQDERQIEDVFEALKAGKK